MLLLFENFQSWRNKILDKGYERNGVMSLLWNRFRYRSVLGISDNNRVFVWNERILVLMQKTDRFLKICRSFYLFTAKQICTKWRKRFVISPLRTSSLAVGFVLSIRFQTSYPVLRKRKIDTMVEIILPISQMIPPIEKTIILCTSQQGEVTPNCT